MEKYKPSSIKWRTFVVLWKNTILWLCDCNLRLRSHSVRTIGQCTTLLKMGQPRPLLSFIFALFKRKLHFLQQYNDKMYLVPWFERTTSWTRVSPHNHKTTQVYNSYFVHYYYWKTLKILIMLVRDYVVIWLLRLLSWWPHTHGWGKYGLEIRGEGFSKYRNISELTSKYFL